MRYTDPKLLDHLASNYVLGTLAGGARRRFEKLMNDRYDVRAIVMQWNERLSKMAVSIPDEVPSPNVWSAIERATKPSLNPSKNKVGEASSKSKFGFPSIVSWLGGAAIGLSSALSVVLFFPSVIVTADQVAMRMGERLPQSYVGLLVDSNANGKVLLSSLRHGKTAVIKTIGPIDPPKTGHLILWALPPDKPPIRIGEVMAKGSAEYMLPDTSENLLAKVTKLVVTLEADAQPQQIGSNVVFSGNCAKLW